MVAVRYQTVFKLYPYEKVADQDASTAKRHPVVIVGGGPIGMGLALDLGNKGVPCLMPMTVFRDAVLDLVEHHDFARPLVNSGRLSEPCTYDVSILNSKDALPNGPARNRPGGACSDAPLTDGYLLDQLGNHFTLLAIDTDFPRDLATPNAQIDLVKISMNDDPTGALAERYLGANTSAVYLIRPAQHVASRWVKFDAGAVTKSVQRALGGIRA